MELFHSPDMSWPNLNPQRGIAQERPCPDALRWRTASRQQHSTSYPSLPFRLQFLHQLRATGPRVPDRATESIRQTPLRLIWCRAASVFRRWMLPTVERGPPGHAAFERRL
jgi:hypothetical protein